jgi:hypothetical protein
VGYFLADQLNDAEKAPSYAYDDAAAVTVFNGRSYLCSAACARSIREVEGPGIRYDPAGASFIVSRWPSRDPISEKGGLNLYVFIFNQPLILWDVLGNSPGGPRGYWDERGAEERRQREERHRNRNQHNRCPGNPPGQENDDDDCPYTDHEGNRWIKDPDASTERYHGGNDCFRSGSNQCCYGEDGQLDDEGPDQGTYDYSSPYDEDGNFDFGGWLRHLRDDVIPHEMGDNNYTDNLTEIY